MPALADILKRAFKDIKSVSKEDLAKLFSAHHSQIEKLGSQKLYRRDRRAAELMEKGFSTELSEKAPLASDFDEESLVKLKGGPDQAIEALRRGLTEEEELGLAKEHFNQLKEMNLFKEDVDLYRSGLYDKPGLYWSGTLKGLGESIPLYQREGRTIQGIMRPGASVRAEPFPSFPSSGSDFYKREDGWEGTHFIQKNPHNVLAKFGDKYKIIGLAAALGLGHELTQPEEAEAGLFQDIIKRGIGTVTKSAGKTVGKEASSAEARLVGQMISGKTVKEVKKGLQDWRYLVFDDGTEQPVKKDVIHSLSREFGTKAKMEELGSKEQPEQLIQAIKSLNYHTSRQKAFTTQSMRDDYRKQFIGQMKELGVESEEMIHIDSPVKAYIPKKYADILEQSGIIKIKPRKKKVE